jgi:hypothetical protein
LGTQDEDKHYEHIDVRDQRDNKQWTTLGTQDEDNHYEHIDVREYQRDN